MNLSLQDLMAEAASTGFPAETLEKCIRLVSLLNALRSHPFLKTRIALKGGTALNLFIFPVPRLSIDIDLNFIGASDRETMPPPDTMASPCLRDPSTSPSASSEQMEKILSYCYCDIGRQEGAKCLIGGGKAVVASDIAGGYYVQPTIFKGHNKMRIFQEEIFGPVVALTTFKDEAEAIAIGNDTLYGLGSGVWTRNINIAYRMGRGIQAGRVWTNCYHLYPAHSAVGGYKQSGIGRETHKMMLDHYQQTKNILVSYSPKAMGFFWPVERPEEFRWK